MRAAPLVALSVDGLLVGGILSACSPAAMGPVTVFADPGKYQFYNCEQLAGQRTHWTNRELELRFAAPALSVQWIIAKLLMSERHTTRIGRLTALCMLVAAVVTIGL